MTEWGFFFKGKEMSRVFTGAKAIIKINSEPVAWVSSINVTIENRLEEIPQIDDLLVAEYAENGHRASATISSFKTVTNTIESLGLDPRDYKNILILPELVIEIFNSDTEIIAASLEGVKFEGGSGQLDARGVWQGTWRFKARRCRGI